MAKVPIPLADVQMDTNDGFAENAGKFVGVVGGLVGLGGAAILAQRVLNAGADAAGAGDQVEVL